MHRINSFRRRVVPTICGLALLLATPFAATAKTLYVKASGSDWATNCTAVDPCATIARAVYVAASGDTIHVGPGLFHEPYGVVIDKHLTIVGAGSQLVATRVTTKGNGTVFTIEVGRTVALSGMLIFGGSNWSTGGILNKGTLSLQFARVRGNVAISAVGTGGIRNSGWLLMNRVVVELNTGSHVGGLRSVGSAIVIDSRIVSNTSETPGGPAGVESEGALIMVRSSVAWNNGAGISSIGPSGVSLTDVTISRNASIGLATWTTGAVSKLTNTTIAENGNFGISRTAGDIELQNTIVAKNGGWAQCYSSPQSGAISLRHSLIGDVSCSTGWPDPFSMFNVDPQLSPLLNTGFTPIHRLLAGSPAIDAGSPELCSPTDQHSTLRPLDGNADGLAQCDIGAHERKLQRELPDQRPGASR